MKETRRQAREWAVQMLTAADLGMETDAGKVTEDFWSQLSTLDGEDGGIDGADVSEKLRKFANERVEGVLANLQQIDARLAPLLDHWDLSRLGTVERAVLRLAAWELSFSDIPQGVVINEAVDLVNWFSSPKSRALVNGVLDRYGKELKK